MDPAPSPGPEGPTATTDDRALPLGLCFFTSASSEGHRRRRGLFVVAYLVAGSMVLWPVYPLFAGAKPQILGLPLSIAWVVLALATIFVALVWFYANDDDPRSADDEGAVKESSTRVEGA